MNRIVISVYDFLEHYKVVRYVLLIAIISIAIILTSRISFKEDISDFIPNQSRYQESLKVFEQATSANRIFVLFQLRDTSVIDQEIICDALTSFGNKMKYTQYGFQTEIDYSQAQELTSFVCDNAPLLLDVSDYEQLSRKLTSDSISIIIQEDMEKLLFPSGNFVSTNIEYDPLGLFTKLIDRLQTKLSQYSFNIYDGYIFSADNKKGIAFIDSPFGSSESKNNHELLSVVQRIAKEVEHECGGIKILTTGAPIIAVENAQRIKDDSIIAVGIALVLILGLLFFSLRSWKSIFLIGFSIAFGWLIAMAGISLFHTSVSIIVIGIASVVIGIAVNYPLHYLSHLRHTPNPRKALTEIISPLLTGNITTVGAFAALIPLSSQALRDLGIFAAFMLVGTILFVIVFLPHFSIKCSKDINNAEIVTAPDDIITFRPRKRWPFVIGCIVTLVLGYFSLYTEFDTNIGNINFLSEQQRDLLSELSAMRNIKEGTTTLFHVSKGKSSEETLRNYEHTFGINASLIVSKEEQEKRIKRWNTFVKENKILLVDTLSFYAKKYGFSDDAFSRFTSIINHNYASQQTNYFSPLLAQGVDGCLFGDTLLVRQQDYLSASTPNTYINEDNCWSFNIQSLNSSIVTSISDNFNYIGWTCGLIVFFFLWFSFRNIEHTLIAFLPMLISWMWILGVMYLFGLKFNMVNLILATFIFGQGDDYSIFITEGLIYQQKQHRNILPSFKHAIILSAIIMFIGIGVLAFAKHPALFSLGIVTIVGMASVVLMTYYFPPYIFGWLYYNRDGSPRKIPITLRGIMLSICGFVVYIVQLCIGNVLGQIYTTFLGKDKACDKIKETMFSFFQFDIHHLFGVNCVIHNDKDEQLSKPAMIISNHCSILDPILLMSMNRSITTVYGPNVGKYRIMRNVLSYSGMIPASNRFDSMLEDCKAAILKGKSILMFPEGERNTESKILRFHAGAFQIASELNLDIIPVYMIGLDKIMPKGTFVFQKGEVNIYIGDRIVLRDDFQSDEVSTIRRKIQHQYSTRYNELLNQNIK